MQTRHPAYVVVFIDFESGAEIHDARFHSKTWAGGRVVENLSGGGEGGVFEDVRAECQAVGWDWWSLEKEGVFEGALVGYVEVVGLHYHEDACLFYTWGPGRAVGIMGEREAGSDRLDGVVWWHGGKGDFKFRCRGARWVLIWW